MAEDETRCAACPDRLHQASASKASQEKPHIQVDSPPASSAASSVPALHSAAGGGDERQLCSLLAAGANLEGLDGEGKTALAAAAARGRQACLRALLAAGAAVEAADRHGHTPLHWAAACGQAACIPILLAGGACMEAADCNGLTAVHLAAGRGHVACLAELAAAGASLLGADKLGNLPIHVAACNGHVAAVRWLAAAGAQAGAPPLAAARNGRGKTPRQVAADFSQRAVERLLRQLERQRGRPVCTGLSHQPGCRSPEAAEAVAAAAAAELLAEEEQLKEQRRGQQHAGAAAGQGRRQQRRTPAGRRKAAGALLQRQPAASAAAESAEAGAAPGDAWAGGGLGGEGTADSAVHVQLALEPVQLSPEGATASCLADQSTTPGLRAAQQGLPSHASADTCSPQLPPVSPQQPVKAEVQAAGLDEGLLADLLCPITQELMEDPVVAADGETYERAAIQAWIARQVAAGQVPCSPLTNVPLPHTELQTNRVVRRLTAALAAAGLRPEL